MKTLREIRKRFSLKIAVFVLCVFQISLTPAGFAAEALLQNGSPAAVKQYDPKDVIKTTSQNQMMVQSLSEPNPLSAAASQTAAVSTQKQLSLIATNKDPNTGQTFPLAAFYLKVQSGTSIKYVKVPGTGESFSLSNFSVPAQSEDGNNAVVRRGSTLFLVGIGTSNFGTVTQLNIAGDLNRTIGFAGNNVVTSSAIDNYYGPSTRSVFFYVIDKKQSGTAQSTLAFSAGSNNLYVVTSQESPITGLISPLPFFYLQIEDKTTKKSRFIMLPGSGESFSIYSFAITAANTSGTKVVIRGGSNKVSLVDLNPSAAVPVRKIDLPIDADAAWTVRFINDDTIMASKVPTLNFPPTVSFIHSESIYFFSISLNKLVQGVASKGVVNQEGKIVFVISSQINPITGKYLSAPAFFVQTLNPVTKTSTFQQIDLNYEVVISTGSNQTEEIIVTGTPSSFSVSIVLSTVNRDTTGRIRKMDNYSYKDGVLLNHVITEFDLSNKLSRYLYETYDSQARLLTSADTRYTNGVKIAYYYKEWKVGVLQRFLTQTFYTSGQINTSDDYRYDLHKRYYSAYAANGVRTAYTVTTI